MCISVVGSSKPMVGSGFDTSTLGLVKTLLSIFKAGGKKNGSSVLADPKSFKKENVTQLMAPSVPGSHLTNG